MRVDSDDELYRVDAVWLGPPGWWGPLPWRARYVAWGVGIAVFLGVFTIARKVLDAPLGFFTVAWCVVATVAATRWIGARLSHERPLTGVAALWLAELRAPRQTRRRRASAPTPARVAVRSARPRPRSRRGRARARRRQTRPRL